MNLAAQQLRPIALGNIGFVSRELNRQIKEQDDILAELWIAYWAARGDYEVEDLDKKTKGRVNSLMGKIYATINKRQGLRVERAALMKHTFTVMEGEQPCYL